ncbi:MAG: AraC family transcriptional regulator [Roseibium sp.]
MTAADRAYGLLNTGDYPLLIDAKRREYLAWEPKVDAVWARLVETQLINQGFDSAAALAKAGISKGDIAREHSRVAIAKCDALFEAAAELTGDDLYGLRMGQSIDPREIGLLAYLGLSSPTLLDAIRNLSHYVQVFTDNFVLRLDQQPEGTMVHSIVNGPADFTARQANEAALSALLGIYRLFAGRMITPLQVNFKHSRKSNIAAFRKVFGCEVHFQCETTGLLLKNADLNSPLASSDDRLLAVLRHYCEDILSKRNRHETPFLADVNARIVDLLPQGRASATIVAKELGLSPRTFLRRLRESETSFQKLTDDLRIDLAEVYLKDPQLSMKEIAFLLGYSSSSAFTHGFKRLEGKSPGEFRTALG